MSATVKPSSNWSKLKTRVTKPKVKEDDAKQTSEEVKPLAKLSAKVKANYVGLDCEMVGIGPDGTQSALARCCLVDYDGEVIYDEFVRPPGFVTDFRTKWSGVRKKDLRQGTAISLQECQTAVANILKEKVLVGHALRNDLDVLMLSHPRTMIRDTATFRPYMRIHGKHGKMRPRALKDLTKEHLNMVIQDGEHDPGVDARCAMFLYQKKREEWETHLKDTKNAARQRATLVAEEHKLQSLAAEAALKAARLLSRPGHSSASGSGSVGEDGENVSARRVQKETTLHTQEKKEKGKKSKGVSTYKDGGVGKSVSMDVEVQVLGGDDDESDNENEASDANHSDNEILDPRTVNPLHTSSTTLSVTKKRKISKNGFITSNSTKHHRSVDGRIDATKRAKTETEHGSGKQTKTSSGMFGGVFGLGGGDGSSSDNSGGKKLKSIAEVDRAMKSAHSKVNKKA